MKGQVLLPGIPLPTTLLESPAHGDAADAHDAEAAAQEAEQGSGQTSEHDDERWPALHDMMGSLFVFEVDHPKPVPVEVLGIAGQVPPEQEDLIRHAHVIAAGQPLLDNLFPERETPQDGVEYLPLRAPLEPVLHTLAERHKAGRRVVVLADGDPLFFGIGATLTRHLPPAALRFHPALSSLQKICARAHMPWHNVHCVSLHGRDSRTKWRAFNVAVTRGNPVCVLTDAEADPALLARHLLDRGVDWFELRVFERLGCEDERCRCLSLREAAFVEDFTHPCSVLLCPIAEPRRPQLGLPEHDLAVEKGLITKAPVRAAALGMLRLQPEHVLWDVGSGSGAVALEACALCHAGCVVAVERSAGRALCIKENRRRFGAAILEVHTDAAPDCFDQLPEPDRVFVGGGLSGTNGEDTGEDLLSEICHRLKSGGTVVVSCVLMGTLHMALEFFRSTGWPTELISVQAAEGAELAGDLRLSPFNPVFLIACRKP